MTFDADKTEPSIEQLQRAQFKREKRATHVVFGVAFSVFVFYGAMFAWVVTRPCLNGKQCMTVCLDPKYGPLVSTELDKK